MHNNIGSAETRKIRKSSRNADGTLKIEYMNAKLNRFTKDKNLDILGNLYTKGRQYKINGEKTSYTGYFHIDLRNNKAYTGESPYKGAIPLIPLDRKSSQNILPTTSIAKTTGVY